MVVFRSTLATLALIYIAGASPITQDTVTNLEKRARDCKLDAFDPKSWAASGAEKKLGDFLDKNGPGKSITPVHFCLSAKDITAVNWLQAISDAEMGPNTIVIDCAKTSSNSCKAPEGAATCDKYECRLL